MPNDKLIKMNKKNPYENFTKYILRTPLLSVSSYKELTSKDIISENEFRKICENKIFQESIFLASPILYDELIKWINGKLIDRKKTDKLKISLLKYISRMSSRCTPFGLFAGYSIGEYGETNNISLESAIKNKRNTRLDMNYLVALSQNLEKIDNIKKQLLFFPNSSIYKIGNKIRYIEYRYYNNSRTHFSIEVENNKYIEIILKKAAKGALINDLKNILTSRGIDELNAIQYINELIDSQVLTSELEPSVSGLSFLDHIIHILEKINDTEEAVFLLNEIKQKMDIIDSKVGNNVSDYTDIIDILKKLNTDFDIRYIFQTDMILNHKENTLSKSFIYDIKKGISLLNKISLPPSSTFLSKFKDAFTERYEQEEISLSKALDVELGIGDIQNYTTNTLNPLIDNLFIPKQQKKEISQDLKWSSINALFQKKLNEAFKSNSYIIILYENDFKEYDETWNDLPDTISFITELVELDGKEKIKLSLGSDSSAANILGRFCIADKGLHDYVNEIIDTENKINQDKILAEIVHLPESRVGNILMRPDFRKYEIPYLSKSNKIEKHQITLNDLMISIKSQNKILLRSRKHNKEVIPRLTNSHNYNNNSLPVYQFLAKLQTQNKRLLSFSFGPFAEEYVFLPRVEYHNFIIHEATWNLNKSHIELLVKNEESKENILDATNRLREKYKIPSLVMLVDGDNKLLINLKNVDSIKMFIDVVKNRTNFKITEFLFSDKSVVTRNNEYYSNEIIISFYNADKLKNNRNVR